MNYLIKKLLYLVIVTLSLQASQWKLQNMEFQYTQKSYDQYIYIPEGEYFQNNTLTGDIFGSDNHSHVNIYMDDRLITTFFLHKQKKFAINLPSMKSGFHKLTISGVPDIITLSQPNQEELKCPQMKTLPFSFENVLIDFQSSIIELPKLKNYQEVFFNPSFPSKKPLTASFVFEEKSNSALSAAARLISSLQRPMRAVHYTIGENNSTDFSIVFRKIKTFHQSSSITIQRSKRVERRVHNREISLIEPARLTFNYNNDEELLNCVNALLNRDYRKLLDQTSITLSDMVKDPEWGVLEEYKTLKDLGLNDIQLQGDGRTTLRIYYPIYWQATDRIKGTLLLRSQSALPKDTHLNIWLDDVLAGSLSVAYFGSGDIQRTISVDSLYMPKTSSVKLEFDASLNTKNICDLPMSGKLWISAIDSIFEMPHRQKTGIISLLPALVAKPTIALSPISTATLSAAATFIQEEQKITQGKPLAYQLLKSQNSSDASLEIKIDKSAITNFFKNNSDRLNISLISHLIWLHSQKDGKLQVIAYDDAALEKFSDIWPNTIQKISDGTVDAVIDTRTQEVFIINQKKSITDFETNKISKDEYTYGVIAIAILFTLTILWLLLGIYRKVTKK